MFFIIIFFSFMMNWRYVSSLLKYVDINQIIQTQTYTDYIHASSVKRIHRNDVGSVASNVNINILARLYVML